jgi:general secretion pathway protein A
LLLNFEYDCKPGLTLLLAGQPAIMPLLERTPQLDERMAVKCLLRPFDARQTAEYVRHRLHLAGAERDIFAADALEALFRVTLGAARRVNRLCDLALLIGFAEQRESIGAAQIDSVHQELVSVAAE